MTITGWIWVLLIVVVWADWIMGDDEPEQLPRKRMVDPQEEAVERLFADAGYSGEVEK